MGFRLPIALNPFKSRVPSTRLGKFGKAVNPLNPVNAAAILLEETLGGLVGSTLGPEARQRVEYFGYGGILPGIALNVLDAGAVSANQDQLVKQAQAQYLREQKQKRAEQTRIAELAAPQQTRATAPSPAVQRPVEETRPPVSRQVPTSPAPDPARTEELVRQMVDLGITAGMTDENMRTWASRHQGLAERLVQDRMSREARLAKQFADYPGYS